MYLSVKQTGVSSITPGKTIVPVVFYFINSGYICIFAFGFLLKQNNNSIIS